MARLSIIVLLSLVGMTPNTVPNKQRSKGMSATRESRNALAHPFSCLVRFPIHSSSNRGSSSRKMHRTPDQTIPARDWARLESERWRHKGARKSSVGESLDIESTPLWASIEGIHPMRVQVGIKELNPDKACYLLPIRLPIHRINQKRRKLGPAEIRTAGKVF